MTDPNFKYPELDFIKLYASKGDQDYQYGDIGEGAEFLAQCLTEPLKKAVVKTAVVGITAAAIGTGGNLTSDNFAQVVASSYYDATYIGVSDNIIAAEVYSLHEMMKSIKQDLDLKITEMADIFDVSRPTVYAWLNGSQEPQIENSEQINRIFKIAKLVSEKDIPQIGLVIRRKIFSGKSFVDKLKMQDYDESHVESINALAIKEANTRKELSANTKPSKMRSIEETAEDFSTSLYKA